MDENIEMCGAPEYPYTNLLEGPTTANNMGCNRNEGKYITTRQFKAAVGLFVLLFVFVLVAIGADIYLIMTRPHGDVIDQRCDSNGKYKAVTELNQDVEQLAEGLTALNISLQGKYKAATELNQDAEQLAEGFTSLNTSLQGLVEQYRLISGTRPVAFLATIAAEPVKNLQRHDTVKFNTVLTNLGGGYSPDSGYFVAPVTGVYLFSVSISATNSKNTEVHLLKNGKSLTGAYGYPGNIHDQGSTTAVIEMTVNDKVWVWIHAPYRGVTVGGWTFSSFTGCLIRST